LVLDIFPIESLNELELDEHNTFTNHKEVNNMASRNSLVVPQANQALDQMKYEIAQELGISIPQDGYYGNMATRDTGSIGGYITRRLVQIAEQQLAGSSNNF
jgi:hypothetical protein